MNPEKYERIDVTLPMPLLTDCFESARNAAFAGCEGVWFGLATSIDLDAVVSIKREIRELVASRLVEPLTQWLRYARDDRVRW